MSAKDMRRARHFSMGHGLHTATVAPIDPPVDWVELPEGDDGKCEWCREADRRTDAMLREEYGHLDDPERESP